MQAPTPQQIKQTRLDSGLTRKESAALIHSKYRTWQDWELGTAKMHPAFYELFLIKCKNK